MLPRADGARFPPNVALGIQAKEFSLGFIRPENLGAHGLSVFRRLLASSKGAGMCLLLRSGFRLAALPYTPDWWSAGCPFGCFSHLQRGTLELCQSDH